MSLGCILGLGPEVFERFLRGAEALDRHFLEAPLARNAPVLLALAQIVNVDALERPARTVAPYAHGLRRLPAFLQQLEMESNGKRVTRDGRPVGRQTCPVVFGEPGTNGQHAFFQQIHQGPMVVPAEFIVVRRTHETPTEAPLWANALAQAQALMWSPFASGAQGATQGAIPRRTGSPMRYLHTMVRVTDLDASLRFWCDLLGLQEVRRMENEAGRFTLVFLAAPKDLARSTAERSPEVELTYNWDPEVYAGGRNFGHLAYKVDDIHVACRRLMDGGVTINRPPRDGRMAFVRSPDGISIELLQEGEPLVPAEPWASMPNTGTW